MTFILSVSISEQQKAFIDENQVSPSAVLQEGLNQMIESFKVSAVQLQELRRKIDFLQKTIDKQRNFIESKNLMEDYVKIV
jgi:hypothetical protein